jgi:hypothetical protein
VVWRAGETADATLAVSLTTAKLLFVLRQHFFHVDGRRVHARPLLRVGEPKECVDVRLEGFQLLQVGRIPDPVPLRPGAELAPQPEHRCG